MSRHKDFHKLNKRRKSSLDEMGELEVSLMFYFSLVFKNYITLSSKFTGGNKGTEDYVGTQI